EKSTAILPIPEPLLNSLKEWREYNPYPLVLCMEDGRFMDPKYAGRTIKSKARRLGLYFHPHMLRHTFVTNLILSGADLKTVSELARHKSASTSLQVYTETSDLRKAEAIARTFEDSSPHLLA
uniref:tyrosine-type recombinase/integrase n=1 Tax=Faecalibaculum rodentium TaxID=1702221 RepID=UPI0023F1ED3B